MCALPTVPVCISVCVFVPQHGLRSRAQQESCKGATVVCDVCHANTRAGEIGTLGSAHWELALTLVTL